MRWLPSTRWRCLQRNERRAHVRDCVKFALSMSGSVRETNEPTRCPLGSVDRNLRVAAAVNPIALSGRRGMYGNHVGVKGRCRR